MIENHSHFQNQLRRHLRLLLCTLIVALTSLAHAKASVGPWQARVPEIQAKLGEALNEYRGGKLVAAKKACDDAYFGLFEKIGSNMEVAIRKSISMQRAATLEGAFGEIRKSMVQSKDAEQIFQKVKTLSSDLLQVAAELDQQKVSLQ